MSVRKRLVLLSDEARDDLRAIALYGVVTWGEQQAVRYHGDIEGVLSALADYPNLGQRKDDLPGDLRSIRVGEHSILYRVGEDAVRVLRILHARMDATHHLDL